jgi:serine/threonine protein phosphatase 1
MPFQNSGERAARIARTLPCNALGRDFVVGDLHGCTEKLSAALAEAGFNRRVDRLISVGDLTDRGPDSLGVLRLLLEPWFFAVRGNHDDMLLSALGHYRSSYHSPGDFYRNGGDWLLDLPANDRAWVERVAADRLLSLPHVLSVMGVEGGAVFHVVHAQLEAPTTGVVDCGEIDLLSDSRLTAVREGDLGPGAKIKGWTPESARAWAPLLNWSRGLAVEAHRGLATSRWVDIGRSVAIVGDQSYEEGLSPVFCGHSVMPCVVMHRSHVFIDTGACLGANRRLTVLPALQAIEELNRVALGYSDEIGVGGWPALSTTPEGIQ